MSEGEGKSLGVFKQNVEDMALEELQRLTVRRETVASELKAIDDSIRGIRNVLKAVGPKQVKPAKKPQGKKTNISPGAYEKAMNFITDNESEITAESMAKAVGLGGSYGNMIVKQLREEGHLRLSATQGSLKVYRSTVYS